MKKAKCSRVQCGLSLYIAFIILSANIELDTIYSNSVELQRIFLKEFYREFFVSGMTHRPPSNCLDTKYPIKNSKLIPWEHSKTHDTGRFHSTHRQDIGKLS